MTVHLSLELRLDGERLAGVLRQADGTETVVAGWLDVLRSVEAQQSALRAAGAGLPTPHDQETKP